jgi:DNA primase
MARIADAVVEQLKQGVSLRRLVESQGFALKRHGKDWVTCCPFHDDKTPSLVISEAQNLWHCLGACGTGGSVIDWVMKTQGVSFRMACELLQHDPGALVGKRDTVRKNTTTKLASPLVSAVADDQALLHQVVGFYHSTLRQSPEALAYLQARGLHHPELIDTFQLGFANRTLAYRLPEKNRKAGADIRTQLQRVGILRESGHEHFNGSIVVPVFDASGAVVEMYGRKLLDNLRAGTPKHTYLPGEHAGVWNLSALQSSREIILCEALLDAMTFWVHGFRNVTASYGVNGFTDEHLQAFVQHGVERVLIAYDRDEAGNAAAEKLAEKLQPGNIACYRVLFPNGMDANAFAQTMNPPARALELVLRKAEPMLAAKKRTVADSFLVADLVLPLVSPGVENLPVPASPEPAAAVPVSVVNDLPLLPASPVAAAPVAVVLQGEQQEDGVYFGFGERHYRVRGLEKNTARDELKIQLRVQRGEHLHLDRVDLYSSRQRQAFIQQAGVELGCKDDVIRQDLSQLLLALETALEQQRREKSAAVPAVVTVDGEARTAALALLQSPDLLQRILQDFDAAGVVGEEANKLTGYLACVSRKLDKPLAVMIQSSSAAGKSSLMEAVLALMPEEERVQYSAMTGQSLFYMGETNLQHKILAIAEEEGAHNASYALKLLQSEGEVTIASTGKDDTTGNLVTKEYRVQGPVMLFLTTTAIDIDEELLNRCLVLSVNESREQTQAIHRAQRSKRTLAGLQAKLEREAIIALHRNAQRLLRPLHIINPYADQLTFLDDKTRTRRDHEKYLTLIDSIALLHQHQREIKTITHDGKALDYIEVQLSDIAHANRLAHEVLGRTLDELPPQTRKLLKMVWQMVQRECAAQQIAVRDYRFSRKSIRDFTGWGNTQLKLHCHRLEDMEYLLTHRGGRGQSFEYELLYSGTGDDDARQLMGLIAADDLLQAENYQYDNKKSGLKQEKSVASRPQVVGVSGSDNALSSNNGKALREVSVENQNSTSGGLDAMPSYRTTAGMQEVGQRREQLPSDTLSLAASL